MFTQEGNIKKPKSDTSTPPTVLVGLLNCSDFLAPNECSKKIFGLFACFLCKSVGDINFSDIFSKVLELIGSKQAVDILALFRAARNALPDNKASIERCLILNRFITYIEDNQQRFTDLVEAVLAEMILQIQDNQQNQLINYPADFRQREKDFYERMNAQNRRRFSFYSPAEAKAPSLIHLQNRTTEHLNCLIDSKMRYESHFWSSILQELETIFSTSFMINNQPHSGVNPVLVYKKEPSGIYTAKGSVRIVSLLYDFMQTHPNMIELGDIELTLCPVSAKYQLIEPQKLVWKTCELRITPNERPRMVQYADLTNITIQLTPTNDKTIHFSEKLHFFTFSILLQLNLNEHQISKIYRIPLQSLPFAITSHHGHLAYSLTKVMINDIERFAQSQATDINVIMDFVLRYFMHRTGLLPKHDLRLYLKKELERARANKPTAQSLEEIYFDFLMAFISQVDFMGKNTILALFYADELFLGPCDSKRAEEIIRRPSDTNSPIVALRFNTIRVNDQPSSPTAAVSKSMKAPPCSVRVVINNERRNRFENRTLDTEDLLSDLLKFVSTANEPNAHSVHVLSNFDGENNVKAYNLFRKYYHEQLHQIYKIDSKYLLLVDLFVHVKENGCGNPDPTNTPRNTSQTGSPISAASIDRINNTNSHLSAHGAQPISTDPLNQQQYALTNDKDVINYVLSNSPVFLEIVRQFRRIQLSTTTISTQLPVPPAVNSAYTPFYESMAHASQQPQPPSFTIPYQSTNTNLYQNISENGDQQPSHQYPRSITHHSMSGVSFSSSDSLPDQISFQSTNEDNQSRMDELFSSESSQ